jgi:hypothetical protein
MTGSDQLAPPHLVCSRARQQGHRVGLLRQAPVAMEVSEWFCATVPGYCGAAHCELPQHM